ncbi:metabolite traffic protein EboE [Pontibacter harenae]|uniref:metabolite traffic protein EboE n=1 Tax=Pontibacter harenae TaxID=2894083 RepID=UPI001E3DDA6E|nr:metabolite traffic protein EboE [Pontibacter harenae]MCC9167445.1 metabolite traffic protein EboE [Pontibacter harenae]
MYLNRQYHLSYCTNIHQGETWDEVFQSLKEYFPPLKQQLSPDQPLGIGLRLSDLASRELMEGEELFNFKAWLQEQGLYVFTMNGFPFGGFHKQVVKDDVHQPDWTTKTRVAYTIRLAHILSMLLPKGVEGGISTSPLSYKPWYTGKQEAYNETTRTATENLVEVVAELISIKSVTGKSIHIDIEPEPDGFLENSHEFISFYTNQLIPVGVEKLKQELSAAEVTEAIKEHIQLCYDVCHFALAYEKPAETFDKLKEAGIKVGKIQLSAALKVTLPNNVTDKAAVAERLAAFVEPTYLHQVVERGADNKLTQYPDLPQALAQINKPDAEEWRIHFHVPLFTDSYNGLLSTQGDIKAVLDILKQEQLTQHLEVETYTWDVLPQDLKKELHDSIQREMEWVIENLK